MSNENQSKDYLNENADESMTKHIPVLEKENSNCNTIADSLRRKESDTVPLSKANFLISNLSTADIKMVSKPNTNSNSGDGSITQCPICNLNKKSAVDLEEHINRAHFDSSFSAILPVKEIEIFSCPFCSERFEISADLESHVNSIHVDILSPTKDSLPIPANDGIATGICPVCFRSEFSSCMELELHIDAHFSCKLSIDESELSFQPDDIKTKGENINSEHQEFSQLRAQYGMDNEGNFSQQSITNMEKLVYSGEMSVASYYEQKIELKIMEQKGLDDGKSCTIGLLEPIRSVCESSNKVRSVWLCTAINHYASTYGDRGWGCGYRNIQMLLSCLQSRVGFYSHLFPGLTQMPSISQIQKQIESAWKFGFDVQGCEQLEGQLVNTRKWIGATEVVSLLASSRIRCRLIDCHKPTGTNGTHPELFRWCLEYFSKPSDFKPPIYLQHQGHSRTIIGVEKLSNGECSRLLIFDPGLSPTTISQMTHTQSAFKAMHLIRKNINSMKSKQYQMVVVDGDLIQSEEEYNESKVLRSIRIPKE